MWQILATTQTGFWDWYDTTYAVANSVIPSFRYHTCWELILVLGTQRKAISYLYTNFITNFNVFDYKFSIFDYKIIKNFSNLYEVCYKLLNYWLRNHGNDWNQPWPTSKFGCRLPSQI